VANWICSDLARAGVVVVSGFAVGLDSAAHRGALLAGGRTVAVLGCGIDVDYPKDNASAKQYITKKGLLLTEFLPGTEPYPKNFPTRNRILSGISLGTLVIQAPERSGSLITASLALEQGRNVFCVPPADIFDKRYAGVVKYLRDGAIPVFSYLDIINEYYHSYAHKLLTSVLFAQQQDAEDSVLFGESEAPKEKKGTAARKEKTGLKEKKTRTAKAHPQGALSEDEAEQTEKTEKETETEAEAETAAEISQETVSAAQKTGTSVHDFSTLSGLELQIAVLLSQEHQMHIDAIVEQLEADESEIASALTELALGGYVKRCTGQCYGIL
jgi:DNA processing protein